eukprot:scaffold184742_cov17-Tisochrysis_lutea.AAC.2
MPALKFRTHRVQYFPKLASFAKLKLGGNTRPFHFLRYLMKETFDLRANLTFASDKPQNRRAPGANGGLEQSTLCRGTGRYILTVPWASTSSKLVSFWLHPEMSERWSITASYKKSWEHASLQSSSMGMHSLGAGLL